MIYIGNDIIEIARIDRLINIYGEIFLNKIFSTKEINSIKRKDNSINCSGKFAAKEASAKALLSSKLVSTISFKDIAILNRKDGAPFILLNNIESNKIKNFQISISHTNKYATAIALLELSDN